MGIGNIRISGLVLILVAVLLIFGPSKLPEIGRGFGRSLQEFRKATRELTSVHDVESTPSNLTDETNNK